MTHLDQKSDDYEDENVTVEFDDGIAWMNFNVEASGAQSTTDFLVLPPKNGGPAAATVPAGTPGGVFITRIESPFLPQSVRTTILKTGLDAVFFGRDGHKSGDLPSDVTMVHAGSLDDPSAIEPEKAIYSKDAAQWDRFDEARPKFDGASACASKLSKGMTSDWSLASM